MCEDRHRCSVDKKRYGILCNIFLSSFGKWSNLIVVLPASCIFAKVACRPSTLFFNSLLFALSVCNSKLVLSCNNLNAEEMRQNTRCIQHAPLPFVLYHRDWNGRSNLFQVEFWPVHEHSCQVCKRSCFMCSLKTNKADLTSRACIFATRSSTLHSALATAARRSRIRRGALDILVVWCLNNFWGTWLNTWIYTFTEETCGQWWEPFSAFGSCWGRQVMGVWSGIQGLWISTDISWCIL